MGKQGRTNCALSLLSYMGGQGWVQFSRKKSILFPLQPEIQSLVFCCMYVVRNNTTGSVSE
jgi:hypothetical protein